MDYGHEMTEKELKRLEKKIHKEYEKAYKETKKKADKYLAKFSASDAEKQKLVKAKLLSEADYIKWRESAILTGKHWEDMADTLANDMVNADKMAMAMVSDKIPDFYAMNANYGTYEIESGLGINTSWTLYDHSTVLNLMRKDPEIVRLPSPDIPKDKRWNRQKIHSAITQGVLQGDSIPDISKRLRAVTNMDYAAAIRNARTYTTAAENKGRIDSYERALALGIELEKEWMSTPDGRTRDSHVDLDGERCPVDGTFTNGCRYPGDPMGDPAEVYNCRCTLVAAVKKRDYSNDGRFTRLPEGMTYDDWKEHKLSPKYRKSKGASIGVTGNKYTKEQRVELQRKLDSSSESIRNMWRANQSSFKETEAPDWQDNKNSDRAYFDPDTGTVHLNPEKVVADINPYETHFHEFGHNIDWLSGPEDDYLTSVWKDEYGRSFEQVIMGEWEKKLSATMNDYDLHMFRINLDTSSGGVGGYSFVRSRLNSWRRENNISRDDVLFSSLKSELDSIRDDDKKLESFFMRNLNIFGGERDEFAESVIKSQTRDNIYNYCNDITSKYSISARGDLSDMLERYSVVNGGGDYPLGIGHGKYYAEAKGTLGREAFAEMFSASVSNEESLALIQQELPESYSAFQSMIGGIGK